MYLILTEPNLTSALVLTPILLLVVAGGCILPVLRKLLKPCKIEEISADWLESFSPSAYYPMQGLLGDEDFHFLSRQPGFDLSLYKKLRRDRLHIFRQYLNRLIIDFNRLHTAARFLLAQSSEDHSDLALHLIWVKVRFSMAVVRVEGSYLLCYFGLRSLAVRALISHLEEMSAQLTAISAGQFA